MELRYPNGDFTPVRPWGNMGDRKNDGYLKSRRQLFQVYAPVVLNRSETLAKVEEDFHGALPHWRQYFDTWTFVHKFDEDGIPPFLLQRLEELETANPGITCNHWGLSAFREELFQLHQEADVVTALGGFWAPSQRDVLGLRFEDVQLVLAHIEGGGNLAETDRRPVPPGKLEANALSEAVRDFIEVGFKRSNLVGRFFESYYDVTYGDRIGAAIRNEYIRLRESGILPDDIFWGLQKFITGPDQPGPKKSAAALAILAYFFEQCDIYERPRPLLVA